jgi:hypothetical protein
VDIAAPSEITGEGADGSVEFDVTTGLDGTFELAAAGMVASESRTLSLSIQTARSSRWTTRTFDADQGPELDLDLYVYVKLDDGSLELFGAPLLSGSDEHVDLEAGRTYTIFVDLWDAPTDAVEAPVHTWVVPETAAGNLTVTPESLEAKAGGVHTVTATWSGLDANRRYLGTIDYLAEEALLGRTIVAVNFRPPHGPASGALPAHLRRGPDLTERRGGYQPVLKGLTGLHLSAWGRSGLVQPEVDEPLERGARGEAHEPLRGVFGADRVVGQGDDLLVAVLDHSRRLGTH